MVMKQLDALGGRSWFPKLHHFSTAKFDSVESSFEQHWDYCNKVGSFKPDEENVQTRRRLQAAVLAAKGGASWDAAVAHAWQTCPLLTR